MQGGGSMNPEPLALGAQAPRFALRDLEGRTRRPLDEAAGRPVLLVFVKDDCPTCRFAMPFLERLHAALEYAGVRVYGIAQDDRDRAAAFARETGARFPILIDGGPLEVSRAFGLQTVPSLFLVGGDGRVERYQPGFHRKNYESIAAELAAGAGSQAPEIFRPGEPIPEVRPG